MAAEQAGPRAQSSKWTPPLRHVAEKEPRANRRSELLSASNAPAGAPANFGRVLSLACSSRASDSHSGGNFVRTRHPISPKQKSPSAGRRLPVHRDRRRKVSGATSTRRRGKNPDGHRHQRRRSQADCCKRLWLSKHARFSMSKPQADPETSRPNAPVEDEPVRAGPPNFAAPPPVQCRNRSRRPGLLDEREYADFNSATGQLDYSFFGAAPLRRRKPCRHAGFAGARPQSGSSISFGSHGSTHRGRSDFSLRRDSKDGSVDSLQVVRGIDSRLDANAIAAFRSGNLNPQPAKGRRPTSKPSCTSRSIVRNSRGRIAGPAFSS